MKITKEVKIALTAIAAIIILFFGLNFLKGHLALSDDNTYNVKFSNIQGLSTSSPIYADGYKVGVVRSIEYDYENHSGINVVIEVDKNMRIPKGSTAEVSSDLMGNVKLDLLLANNPRERVEPGGTMQGVVNEGIMGKAKDLVPVVEKMLPKVDSILIAVNTLLNDPAIANSLHNIDGMTADLKTSAASLKVLMAQVNGNLPQMMTKANTVLDNTSTLTGNLANVDVAGTMAKVNQALDNVNSFTKTLNSREGTLGMFMHDPTLYNNMNSLMRSADSLMVDLKAHPKRYVHFSVFGRKDK